MSSGSPQVSNARRVKAGCTSFSRLASRANSKCRPQRRSCRDGEDWGGRCARTGAPEPGTESLRRPSTLSGLGNEPLLCRRQARPRQLRPGGRGLRGEARRIGIAGKPRPFARNARCDIRLHVRIPFLPRREPRVAGLFLADGADDGVNELSESKSSPSSGEQAFCLLHLDRLLDFSETPADPGRTQVNPRRKATSLSRRQICIEEYGTSCSNSCSRMMRSECRRSGPTSMLFQVRARMKRRFENVLRTHFRMQQLRFALPRAETHLTVLGPIDYLSVFLDLSAKRRVFQPAAHRARSDIDHTRHRLDANLHLGQDTGGAFTCRITFGCIPRRPSRLREALRADR